MTNTSLPIEELKRLENPDEIRENPTSGTQCHRTKSRDILGAEYDLKGRAVANYLRINELITPLKRRIDDAEFPIVVSHRAIRKKKENGYERQQNDSDYGV